MRKFKSGKACCRKKASDKRDPLAVNYQEFVESCREIVTQTVPTDPGGRTVGTLIVEVLRMRALMGELAAIKLIFQLIGDTEYRNSAGEIEVREPGG